MSSAGIEVRERRKWKCEKAVESAETKGSGGQGRQSRHGSVPKPRARGKERHHLVQEEVQAGVEEERLSRPSGLRQQGAWTRWESALSAGSPGQTSCRQMSIGSTHWCKLSTTPCQVQQIFMSGGRATHLPASGRGSLEHLLSCCPKALADGRYRWPHDKVLQAIDESLPSAISACKHHRAPKKAARFIKPGEKFPQACQPTWESRYGSPSTL